MKPDRSQKLVLVVDNHPLMLTYMRRLLEKRGDRVLTAEDGLSALKILNQHSPDVIFVDQVMPNISGDKLCRIIRSRPRIADSCVIILSAIAAEAEFRFAEFGANYCIAKGPFDKMSTHILALLYRLDAGGECGSSDRIIGREDIYYRQISRELLHAKKHAEVILNHLTEGVLELTLQGEIVYANPTALRILDSTEELLLGTPFQDLFEGRPKERVVSAVEQVGSGTVVSGQQRIFDIQGRQIWLDMIHIEDEAHQAVTVIMNDLSRQKRDADAIVEQEEKYRSLVENLNDVVFETDTAGLLTYVNPAVEDISGYAPEEIIGRHFKKLLHRNDAPTAEKRLRKILDGGSLPPFEYRLVGKDGHVRWIRVFSTARIQAGKLRGLRGLATDISWFLKRQQEPVGAHPTVAPARPAASVANEISSPISQIDGLVRSLGKRHADDHDSRLELETIKDACRSIREAAEKLCDPNRPAAEGRQRTDINRIIEETVAFVQSRPKAVKAEVKLALAPDLPEVMVSISQVRQVLLNVTRNAMGVLCAAPGPEDEADDRSGSGPTLAIRTGTESGHVFIAFLDNGPGIAEGDLQQIFDPFYTRKTKMGPDVGLPFCRQIIEDNGGQMTAENRPEGGAKIIILLPIP
jgi:PAS domain S-box-containing protein